MAVTRTKISEAPTSESPRLVALLSRIHISLVPIMVGALIIASYLIGYLSTKVDLLVNGAAALR